jgi:hypothetical protein
MAACRRGGGPAAGTRDPLARALGRGLSPFTRDHVPPPHSLTLTPLLSLPLAPAPPQKDIEEIQKAGTYKRERVITSSQSAHITVNTSSKSVLVRHIPPSRSKKASRWD